MLTSSHIKIARHCHPDAFHHLWSTLNNIQPSFLFILRKVPVPLHPQFLTCWLAMFWRRPSPGFLTLNNITSSTNSLLWGTEASSIGRHFFYFLFFYNRLVLYFLWEVWELFPQPSGAPLRIWYCVKLHTSLFDVNTLPFGLKRLVRAT